VVKIICGDQGGRWGVRVESFRSKRRVIAKGPRPHKGLTAKRIKVMWWVLRAWITAAVVVLPWNFVQMIAKCWVQRIVWINGWDFFARLLKTWGMVTSMPMVVAAVAVGVRRSVETLSGRRLEENLEFIGMVLIACHV
jgi:hypothetical protein